MKEKRAVQHLHKLIVAAQDLDKFEEPTLAVGAVFRFKSGDSHKVKADGSVININRKKSSKAERKALKRQ